MNKVFRSIFVNKNLLKTSRFATVTTSDRSICKSSSLNGLVMKTPEERLCAYNATQYLHRNDTLRSRRVFYRGKVKIDWTMGRPRKGSMPVFSPKTEKQLENPVDDVYIISSYKPQQYTLEESLVQLQKYAEMDFTDENSLVQLRIDLGDINVARKRKTKKSSAMRFLATTEVPFPFNEPNKVAVFTDQEYMEKIALEHGAYTTGSLLLIRKILNDVVKCDAFICTDGYSRIISQHKELKEKLGSYLPGPGWGVVTEDQLVAKLQPLTVGIQFDNFTGDGKESFVKVGRISQPVEELAANVKHIVSKVQEEVRSRNKRIGENIISGISVNCQSEDIPILMESLTS